MDAFDVMAAKMASVKAQMLVELNRELFASLSLAPPRPLTSREKFQRVAQRLRAYFSTLWMALKGEDPYDWQD